MLKPWRPQAGLRIIISSYKQQLWSKPQLRVQHTIYNINLICVQSLHIVCMTNTTISLLTSSMDLHRLMFFFLCRPEESSVAQFIVLKTKVRHKLIQGNRQPRLHYGTPLLLLSRFGKKYLQNLCNVMSHCSFTHGHNDKQPISPTYELY